MLRKLLLTTALCLLAGPALGTEADFEKRMARGVAALDAGNPALAQEEFGAAVKEHPADPEAALYLAIALVRADDPSAEAALKAALRLEPNNQRINLELGTFYYSRKMYEESGDYFESLLALKPEPEISAAAEGFLANIRARSSGKRWGATAMTGMQYDTNVPLAADGVQLPVGTDRRGDWRGVLNLGLEGVAFRDSSQELVGSYSLYQTLHLHLSDFNLTQNLFDVTYRRRINPLFSAQLKGGFESILLGGSRFDNDFSLTPGLFATFREGVTTGLEYRFRDSFFSNTGMFPGNTDRDGVSHSLLLSHQQPLSDILNMRAGYTFERDLAKVDAWSSSSHLAAAGLSVSLTKTLLLDVYCEAASRKYDGILAGATEDRSDSTFTGAATLVWQLHDHAGVSVSYQFSKNNSNIAGYEYSRGVTGIMLQGRY